MNRKTGHRAEWVEALEDRRMFSASHHGMLMAEVVTPSIVGTFTGITHDSNEKTPGTIAAVIETQTAGGKISGFVESKYPHEHTHTTYFSGTIKGDNVTIITSTTTVTGTVSDNGHVLTGSYVFQTSDDSSIGSFVMSRPSRK